MKKLLKNTFQVVALFLLLFLSPVSAQIIFAATLELSPSSGTLNKGCSYTFDIILDTQGAATDGTDALFFYEPAKFTSNTNNITKGSLYPEYIGNSVDPATGRVFISGLAPYTQPYTGKGTFAKIQLTVKSDAAVGATKIDFDFKLNESNDSNVAKRDEGDILTAVTNGNYTIGTGSCTSTGGAGTGTGTGTTGGTGTGTLPAIGQGGAAQGSGGLSGQGSGSTISGTTKGGTGTIDDITGNGKTTGTVEFTYMLTIIGFVLTILGIFGFAIL